MTRMDKRIGHFSALLTASLLMLGLAAAFTAQFVFKILPCALCFEQRWPYFVGIPLSFGLARLARNDVPKNVLRCAGVALLAVLAWSLFLGIRHSGIEWGWWAAPVTCTAGGQAVTDIGDLQAQLKNYVYVPCDKPGWKLFGALSFANLNVLLSAFLLLLNLSAVAGHDPRRLYGSRTVSQ